MGGRLPFVVEPSLLALWMGGAGWGGVVCGWKSGGLRSDWTRGYSEVEFATLKEGAEEWGTRGY